MPTKKPRLISEDPTFLDFIDERMPKRWLGKIAMPFAKDLMKDVRNRENIISSLGFVIRINAFDALLRKVIGA